MGIPNTILTPCRERKTIKSAKMMKFLVALLFLAGASQARGLEKGLLCDVCVDVVTNIDEFLTSDTTIDEILKFVEEICHALGAIDPTLETLCISLVEAQLPDIINGLVNDNLNPTEVCTAIGACEAPASTTTTASPAKKFVKLF